MEITNKPTNKEIDEALAGGVKELWNVYGSLEGDKEFREEQGKVKFGINHKFDIRSEIEGFIERKPAYKIVTIERKEDMDITDFRDEIDNRIKLMKETLRECYDDDFDNQSEVELHGYE